MNINFKLWTAGDGLWSSESKEVHCKQIAVRVIAEVPLADGDKAYGELRVYFAPGRWKVDRDGLIYTDSRFIAELKAALNDAGMSPEAVEDIHYSEQGMQGRDYVSFDVCEDFLGDYKKLDGGSYLKPGYL